MDLAKIIIASKTRNYTDLDAVEIAMAKKLGGGGGGGVTIVPFATGTDEEIVAMIQAAHAGTLDLQTDGGWAVGDTRTISVAAFPTIGSSVTAQSADIVITSFDEYNNCGNVMQFDFKRSLAERSQMHTTRTNDGGYGAMGFKTTVLPDMVNALPIWLKDSLIEFSVYARLSGGTIGTITGNKLALRSADEVSLANYGTGPAIQYYTTPANRIKTLGANGNAFKWWLRDAHGSAGTSFAEVDGSGAYANDYVTDLRGISPFGCL